jgi:hypothetical protein
MRTVLNIFFSVVFFIVFALLIYMMLGSPECNSYANISALNLENAINDVAQYYPKWDGGGIPDDLTYYKPAPITLCQTRGTSVIEAFTGGGPEYQIYYEMFPENPGGTWTEAYPWSGGAMNTIIFWAAFRGVSIGIKYSPSLANLIKGGFKAPRLVRWLSNKFSWVKNKFSGILSNADEASKLVDNSFFDLPFSGQTAEAIRGIYSAEEATMGFSKMRQVGFLTGEIDSQGRAVIDNTPRQWFDDVIDSSGNIIEDRVQLFRIYDADGNLVELRWISDPAEISQLNSQGFIVDEVWDSPEDLYNSLRDVASDDQREWLDSMYVPESQVEGSTVWWEALPNRIKDTKFYQNAYEPATRRFTKFAEELRDLGYRGKVTFSRPDVTRGILYAMDDVYTSNPVAKEIFDDAISQGSLLDKVKGLSFHDYLDNIKDTLTGYGFFPGGAKAEINQIGIGVLIEATKNGEELTQASLLSRVMGIIDTEMPDLKTKFGESEIITHIQTYFQQPQLDLMSPIKNPAVSSELSFYVTSLTDDVYRPFLDDIANTMQYGTDLEKKAAAEEFGLFIGYIEQNKDKYPVNWKIKYLKDLADPSKKVVFYNAINNMNPGSYYAKGFISQVSLEGCPSNSLCLVDKSSLETPNVLNQEASNYFVRLYRPVNDLLNLPVTGIQNTLMQIPSHPRFYIASPCFGTAKVWKSTYNGEPTIFIHIDKEEVVDEDGDGHPDGSNFCYADEGLINQYALVWGISDAIQLVPWSWAFGKLGLSSISKTLGSKIDTFANNVMDPVTLVQGILEGVISWPLAPYLPLGMTTMHSSTSSYGLNVLASE